MTHGKNLFREGCRARLPLSLVDNYYFAPFLTMMPFSEPPTTASAARDPEYNDNDNDSENDSPRNTTPTTTVPVAHPLLGGTDVSLSDIGRQRSRIDDTIRALMSILSNEAKLSDVNTHQATTLHNLHAIKQNLTDMNRNSNEQYQACVTDFLKASRQARQAKDDLNDISRRLANIKTKLHTKNARFTL